MKSIRPYVIACVIAATVAGAAALVYSLAAPSKYGAEMVVTIGAQNNVISADLGDQTQAIANTVSELMASNVVARSVIQQLKLDTSTSEFLENLKTKQKPDAAVLTVSYEGDSKEQAVAVLTATEKAFQTQFAKVGADIKQPKTNPDTGEPQEQLRVKVRVFDPPHALEKKVSPRPVRNIAIAIFLGLMVAIFWTAFRENRQRNRGTTPPARKPAKPSADGE